MTEKEKYAIALVKNCHEYLKGNLSVDEVKQNNYDRSPVLNIPEAKLLYMYESFGDKFVIQIMNNIINFNSLNYMRYQKVYSLRDTVSFDKNKINEICNNIISYVFNNIENQFKYFKDVIENEDMTDIIIDAYYKDFIEPIDLYYCSKYIPIRINNEYTERFFKYCVKHLKFKEKNFIPKLQDVLKKIIKKYEEMI
jgi:hypothetical protein